MGYRYLRRMERLGCGVQGGKFGLRVDGLGLGFRVYGRGFGGQDLRPGVMGYRYLRRIDELEIGVQGLGLGVWGLGFRGHWKCERVWGIGFGVSRGEGACAWFEVKGGGSMVGIWCVGCGVRG